MRVNHAIVGAAAAVFGLVACRGGPSPSAPPPVAVATLPPAPAPTEPLPSWPASSPEVLALESPACEAESRTIYGPLKWIPLCDEALERCFASFDGIQADKMRVQIKPGEPATALVTLRYEGLVLRGFIDLRPVMLYPKRDLILGEVFRADSVAVRAASPGTLTVEATPSPAVFVNEPLRATVACDDLAWAKGWEAPEDQDKRLGAQGPGELWRLIADAAVFRSVPAGKPIAELRVGGDETFVTAYQRRGRHRFVTMWTERGTAFGWIGVSALSPYKPLPGFAGASGAGKGYVSLRDEVHGYRCPHDVPVLAHVDETLLQVGHVPADRPFAVGRRLPMGLRELPLPHPRFTDQGDPPEIRTVKRIAPTDDATLVVQKASLRRCVPPRSERSPVTP